MKAEGIVPDVWLYRGAWQEYEPHEIERAVPLSPEVMLRKKLAIFKHESQKDKALFPGHDEREFWVRAEERTKKTARIYNDLGLPEYYGLEGSCGCPDNSDGSPALFAFRRDSPFQNAPNHLEVRAQSGMARGVCADPPIFRGTLGPPSLNGWRDHVHVDASPSVRFRGRSLHGDFRIVPRRRLWRFRLFGFSGRLEGKRLLERRRVRFAGGQYPHAGGGGGVPHGCRQRECR